MSRLTPREWEYLRWRALGLTISEAAVQMDVSLNTVRRHGSNVFAKLTVSSLQDALRAVGWLVVPNHAAGTGTSPVAESTPVVSRPPGPSRLSAAPASASASGPRAA